MLRARCRDPGEPPLQPAALPSPHTRLSACLTASLVLFVSTLLLGDKPVAGAGDFHHPNSPSSVPLCAP